MSKKQKEALFIGITILIVVVAFLTQDKDKSQTVGLEQSECYLVDALQDNCEPYNLAEPNDDIYMIMITRTS